MPAEYLDGLTAMTTCDFNKMQHELFCLRDRVRELTAENERLRCDLGLGRIIAQQLRDLCGRAAEQFCRN